MSLVPSDTVPHDLPIRRPSCALRKLAHVIYGEFFSVAKTENFIRKFLMFFLFLLKT